MRFERARDVLKHAKTFHLQLNDFYKLIEEQENTPKAQLLLEYIISQEASLAKHLDHFEKETPAGVLDTWLQYVNDEEILQIPKVNASHSKQSVDDILKISMKMSDELIEVYRLVEAQVDESNVKEIFDNLANMQLQKQRQISVNFNRLMDM